MRIANALLVGCGIFILSGFGYGLYLINNLTGPPPPLPQAWETPKSSHPMTIPRGCNGNVQESKLVFKTAPRYPALARQMRCRPPFVHFEITVSEKGRVENTNIIRGHSLCNDAVREALGHWRFTPTMCNGTPAKVILRMRLSCGDPVNGKLDPAVALLLDHQRKGTDPGENKFVSGGRAFLEVTLSRSSRPQAQALTQMGFVITKAASQPGLFFGHISLERLDLLRTSDDVSFIAPYPQ